MSFQSIEPIEKSDFYLDLAFSSATKAAKAMKSKKFKLPTHEIMRKVESTRLGTINRVIKGRMESIMLSFPSIDQLTPFYFELLKNTIDIGLLKKALASLNWVGRKSDELTTKYIRLINNTKQASKMMQFRREYYGRISSLFKQTKKIFEFLYEARKLFRSFPVVKEIPTVAICGFPNIGKTTLLTKLTTANPQIAAYPFTTKKLNVGYTLINKKKIQFIDTPGTLNRFNNMNYIEQQAYLAAKHVADIIIYIYDLSEPYSLREQHKLLKKLAEFKKPILIYLSKTDIIPKDVIAEFKNDHEMIMDVRTLKTRIRQQLSKQSTLQLSSQHPSNGEP